ncbi:unnamed protein product [Durusdinium trenchii]|uniref:Protein kinase domain-containing protein n=1 Tax=Durusdinium trenchii TaxID=1381693 RepID=A0ABP0PMZ4_9DINO
MVSNAEAAGAFHSPKPAVLRFPKRPAAWFQRRKHRGGRNGRVALACSGRCPVVQVDLPPLPDGAPLDSRTQSVEETEKKNFEMSFCSLELVAPLIPAKGGGGYGAKFIALDAKLTRRVVCWRFVAPKHLEAGPRALLQDAVAKDVQQLQLLRHPCLCPYFGAEMVGKELCVVTGYASGGSVADWLADAGPVPEAPCLRVVQSVLQGLEFLHRHMVTHGALRGGNVLLGPGSAIRLGDFGLAALRQTGASAAPLGAAGGLPPTGASAAALGALAQSGAPWMSPEVLEGNKPTAPSDIWSLGCLIARGARPALPAYLRLLVHPSFVLALRCQDLSSEFRTRHGHPAILLWSVRTELLLLGMVFDLRGWVNLPQNYGAEDAVLRNAEAAGQQEQEAQRLRDGHREGGAAWLRTELEEAGQQEPQVQRLRDGHREGGAAWLRTELEAKNYTDLRRLCEAGQQEPEVQRLRDGHREGGAAWLRIELEAKNNTDLRRLSAMLGLPQRNAEPSLVDIASELGLPCEHMHRNRLVDSIVLSLCPLRAPGAEDDVRYHFWRWLADCRTATVAILQHLSALNVQFPAEVPETWTTAMEQLQSIRWPDRLSGLQCSSLLAVLLENRPLQRRGWWQLVDCWDRADPVDVAERLWSLGTCHQAGPAVEPDSGFQDREDVLEVGSAESEDFCKVSVDVWFGDTAVLGTLKHKHKSRGYDEADKLLLRTLMRRYGWERHLDESTACTWMETFEAVKKAEDWSRFAWFLVAHLLHPACRESLRAWHNPVTVLESRLDRSGIAQEVVTLHDDLLAWQDLHGCSSLPEKKQHADLAKRVGKYFNSREARVRTLQKAYPADFAPLPGYRVECLSLEGDSLRGVLWRSAAERALMFSIPGWREEGKGKEEFHPLQDFCKHWLPEADEMECLDLLTNTQRPVTWKLEQVARRLDCSPTVSGVQEALAKRLLRSFPEDAGECLQKFCCRLCPTDCADAKSFKEHVAQEHAGVGLQDTPRMLIEYRKKILVPGMSRQRTIAANFDERLRCPAGTSEEGRVEAACVVCARRFWAHELNKVLLFTDPAQAEGLPQLPDGVDAAVRPSQQHRLCRLLGVPRYAERWPHIALEELQKSAVEHPFLPGEYVLLHRRRMPEDARQPSPVCRDCRTSLTAQVLTLPRHALANDLWLGRALPELRSLSAGTKRLLPLVRVCMQVTVLQPVVLPHAERQKGFIGNTIFLPQASPSSVEAVLPPRAEDMAEHILFVLVGHNRGDLRSSATMQAPREEYVAAVERLRQTSKYYAEAAVDLSRWSGQEETMFEGCVLETDADSYLARELLQRGPADAQGQESSQQEEDDAGMAEDTAESGHLISSIVGLNDTSDDENRWLRVCRDVEDLCRRKPRQYDTDAELVVRNRANNDLGVDAAQMEGANLLGREGAHERGVLRRIRQVQTVAAHGVETERQAQGQMFEVRPQKLVVPSRDTPLSMFEPGTWAMAFPTLFPWGDGVPFLKRETSMEASEVFRYLLLREELQYSGDAGVEDEEQLLPTMYDVQRRLTLMRTSKAYVKRSGFGRHCSVIASVTSEHLLKAMALHGEKADIRELLRSPDVDVGGSRVEAYEVDLAWDLEAPALPSLSAMRRILAADPAVLPGTSKMVLLLPLMLVALEMWQPFVALLRRKDAVPCTHIFWLCFWGHDLGNRLRSVLATAARGELVIELERWSRAVLQAASRIRYDSQQALSQQLEQEVCPLPLSENQRAACGRQYSDVPLRSTEPDGHEAATESSTPLRLTGCFASLRPHYVRRSKAAAFNAASWNAAKGKRGCRFGCFHVELHKETEDSGLEKVRARCLKGWPRVQRAQFMILPRENVPLEEEEAMKNENPHVFQPQRDHPFEGMSNPIAQVSMRCNVDVKYLGRGFCDADLQKLAANEEDGDGQGGDAQPPDGERKKKDKSLDARLHRVVVDMFRDMQDVQFYTGEYASKKFEVSRSLLPELFAGVQRLEAEEAQRQAAVSDAGR